MSQQPDLIRLAGSYYLLDGLQIRELDCADSDHPTLTWIRFGQGRDYGKDTIVVEESVPWNKILYRLSARDIVFLRHYEHGAQAHGDYALSKWIAHVRTEIERGSAA